MVQKHFEFSAVLSKAIAQLRKREESEEEAIKAFYKERRAQLPEVLLSVEVENAVPKESGQEGRPADPQ